MDCCSSFSTLMSRFLCFVCIAFFSVFLQLYVGHMAMYYCMLDIRPCIIVCWTYGHVLFYVGHMAMYYLCWTYGHVLLYVGHMAMYYCMLDIWPCIIVCWTYGHLSFQVSASRKSVDLIAVS